MTGSGLSRGFVFICLFCTYCYFAAGQKVAIIGAGIGGAASAYFTRDLLGEDCSLTVYEKDMRLGGRVENVLYNGTALEIGASILYSKNLHLRHAIDALGLHAVSPVWTNSSRSGTNKDSTMGIWNGSRLVFRSSPSNFITIIKILWRYKFSIFRLRKLVRRTLSDFMQIYTLQNTSSLATACPRGFFSPQELWEAVGLFNLTQVSLRAYLEAEKVGQADARIVQEFVGSVNRVNYNQDNGLNALAGLVSLCPTVTGEVVSVQEGNAAMAVAMLQAAHAEIRPNVTVAAVEIGWKKKGEDEKSIYTLTGGDDGVTPLGEYDAVVIATPFAFSNLAIVDASRAKSSPTAAEKEPVYPPKEFVTTHATFVEGAVRSGFFGPSTRHKTPASVYVEENATVPISSLSLHVQLNVTHGIYKLFSSEPLETGFLDSLFTSWTVLHHRNWKAYPRFHPPEDFVPFVPISGERIYYVNSLETAVSAMEISAIGAKNVAILLAQAYNKLKCPSSSPSNDFQKETDKVPTEL